MLTIGQPFPQFRLPDQNGQFVENADLQGNKYVIYFYPKDDTSGCTTEACEFTAAVKDFGSVRILGVSPDSVKAHTKFVNKYDLGVTLLADEERILIEACGLWVEKSMYGKKYMGVDRTTYLVDETGTVLEIWCKVKPSGHAAAVLELTQG